MNEKELIKQFVDKIRRERIKSFPEEFIFTENLLKIKLPGKALHIGEELFGKYEILTSNGECLLQAESHTHAKYLIYANKNQPEEILIPVSEEEINKTVKSYEFYLDNLIKEIRIAVSKLSSEKKQADRVINEVFRILNLVRY